VLLLGGCANPTRSAEALARSFGLHKDIVAGAGFEHAVYRNSAPLRGGALHVYIDGDGTPYSQPTVVAADPTPRNPLMLRLMALDDAGSIYVGRPCYFALARAPGCDLSYWTVRRYGPEVLASMEAVLRREAIDSGAAHLQLYGFSGGGTLAVLLAQRIDSVSRVVTIGANLDLAAWCGLHHYSPLVGSIDPAAERGSRADLEILHLVGENDANTPPALVLAAARARGGERVRVVAHFEHGCCWQSLWPDILRDGP
jgi:pimeloyl-ACP methyl ester carboxylesterase